MKRFLSLLLCCALALCAAARRALMWTPVPGPFRSRSSISRVRRSPEMRARPPKARPDTLRAHSSVLLKRHAPGMTLAPSGGAQRPLRHTQRPAGRLRADATMPQSRANAGARQAAVCSLPVWPLLS